MATPKKRPKPKRVTAARTRRPARRASKPRREVITEAPPIAEAPEALSLVTETAPAIESGPEPELPPLTTPEMLFAERVPSSEPDRPYPASRRAIFFDVENTSRAQHIARVIEHLQLDHLGRRTEFFAVGNWRVIGHDTARLLARYGAGLVHSAPSVGVRDWSDLRIAVAAGAWLASARPGDVIEIVSDDRAFDAVGDVAAGLGITFRRLSYRGLAGAPVEEIPVAVPERVVESRPSQDRRDQRYRGRYRGRHDRRPGPAHAPAPTSHAAAPREVKPPEPVTVSEEPHTAPHDEIINVVHDLIRANPARTVSIDALANALKARGFSRPSGSPRLITRLRRLKEIELSRTGMITLVDSARAPDESAPPVEAPAPSTHDAALSETVAEAAEAVEAVEAVAPPDVDEDEGPQPGNERVPGAPGAPAAPPASDDGSARRRRRRGGRRWRGRGRPQTTATS